MSADSDAKRQKTSHAAPVAKLTYLNVKGVAEQVRLALYIGEVPFEDARVTYDTIKEMRGKGELPFGQVPILRLPEGDCNYSQANALLRWAGRKTGLYPSEEALQLRCDEVEEALLDLKYKANLLYYDSAMGRHPDTSEPAIPLTAEQVQAAGKYVGEVLLPRRLQQLESLAAALGGPFFCGRSITTCDLSFYVFAGDLKSSGVFHSKGISATILKDFPGLSKVVEAVDAHPKVQEWNANHKS